MVVHTIRRKTRVNRSSLNYEVTTPKSQSAVEAVGRELPHAYRYIARNQSSVFIGGYIALTHGVSSSLTVTLSRIEEV